MILRFTHLGRVLLLATGLLLVPLADAENAPPLPPLPSPDLQSLDATVRDQLRYSRGKLDGALTQKDTSSAQLATLYGELAMLYHAYGFNDAAENAYLRALRHTPRDPRWYYYLGYLYEQTGRPEQAAQRYTYCLRLAPGELPPMLRLALVLTALNRIDQAGLVLTLALQQHKNEPSLRAALGEQALAEERYTDAIELLQAALEQVPAASRLHYPLAMAYRAQGDMDRAREHLALRGSAGIRPDDPLLAELEDLKQGERMLILRGKRAFAASDYAAAVTAFREAIAAKPDSARAHANLGTALMQTGEKDGAMEAYRQAVKLAPDNATAHFNLGVLLAQSGQLTEAADHLESTLSAQPKDSEAHLQLARIYRALDKPDQAASHYRSTVIIDSANSTAWLEGIDLLVQDGQYAKAQAIGEQAFKALPGDGRIANVLARLLAANPLADLRDGERATRLAAKVYQALPSIDHAETVAMALAQAGRCEDAAHWQQQVLNKAADDGRQQDLPRLQRMLAHYREQQPCAAPGMDAVQQQQRTTR